MNRLLAAAGIIIITGGLVLLMAPVSIPLLDANRQVLAETEQAGYCAGQTLIQSQGRGSEEAMTDCIASSTYNSKIDHQVVQDAFCRGIVVYYPTTQADCMQTVQDQQIWPTMKGTWTNAWNSRFKYPGGGAFVNPQPTGDESRTGDREGNEREEGAAR